MKHGLPKYTVLIGLALMLILQACAPDIHQATEPPPPAPTETPVPTAAPEGLCSNPLYPVKAGATWTYASTDSLTGGYSFTDTITDVRDDGFTLTSQFDNLVRTQEWACRPEGLASLTFGGGAAAGLSTSGVQMDLTTSNVQGVNLPKTVNPGDQWPYSLDFEGNMEISGTTANVKGTGSSTFNAIGEESVTVPAGTFNAMKIHVELVLDMQITFSGVNTPAQFANSSDMWFAPDVGWIKSTSSGDIMGTTYNETIELQSYNIP